MDKGINSILMIVGVTTIIVSGFLGSVYPTMYVGLVIGLVTAWGAMPEFSNKRKKKEEKVSSLSFDGTSTQTGMSM